MNLIPERKVNESFAAYRTRRQDENDAVADYLRRGTLPRSLEHRPKLGKAETKRLKRERTKARRAARGES